MNSRQQIQPPGLTRQSIKKGFLRSKMDARVKPAHDDLDYVA
jgi:hypothetical protein